LATRDLLAAPLLREAKKLLAGNDTLEKGKKGLQEVVKAFPGTDAGKEARKLLAAEEAKEAAMQMVDEHAEPHLKSAKKLVDDGEYDKARVRLKEMLKKFPLSKTTVEARKLLELVERLAK
jgi:TolA-binding protein